MGRAAALIVTLLLFPELFQEQAHPFRWVIRNQMLGAEVEVVTQPFYIFWEDGVVNAIFLQILKILRIYRFRNDHH